MERIGAAVERVIEYVKLPPELGADTPEGQDVVLEGGAASTPIGMPPARGWAGDEPQDGGVPLDWPKAGTLSLRHVTLRYSEDMPAVLKGVSVDVAHGERVGIVGRTGAGKSSLLLAVFRMAPTEGSIRIGGLEVAGAQCQVPRRLLRSRLGMIPQDSYLFSGTIRSNLDVEGIYPDEELRRVLRLAHLEQMVDALDGGLEAEVKEKGDNFSAGQVQLLCLARVLLKQPTLVFMDEATASVDLKTDALVQATIRETLTQCTIVTIAHRLATIIDFDRVVVMDAGRVAELGAPHELLQNRKGHLTKLVEATGAASAAELRERAQAAQRPNAARRSGGDAHV